MCSVVRGSGGRARIAKGRHACPPLSAVSPPALAVPFMSYDNPSRIVEKLIELGWGDVLERLVRDGSVVSYFPDWVDIKEVDQPKELTDRSGSHHSQSYESYSSTLLTFAVWANISQTVIDSVTHDLEILEYLEGLHNTAHA